MATEISQLLEHEIPEGRQHLQENHKNLENVANYCVNNYLEASNKKQALDETKNYTTHSLASVAYQINNLATNFLKLLDLQQNQMMEMESNINYLAQTVNIHKEKVARREIGVLTTNRNATRPLGVKNGIILPEQAERPTKYQRKPIDYTIMDDIGHGVKTAQSSQQQKTRTASMSSTASSVPPNVKPPTPPMGGRGSIGKAAGGHYRTPAPPVAPPSVPMTSPYAPGNMGAPGQGMRQSGYGPSDMHNMQNQIGMTTPPIGMARPISQDAPPPMYPGMHGQMPGRTSRLLHQSSSDLPPPPPPMDSPPGNLGNTDEQEVNSPPLPPPPQAMGSPEFQYQQSPPPPPPPEFTDEDMDDSLPQPEEDPYAMTGPNLAQPNWVPQHYLEKVIAIYDYVADKEDELTFSENAVIYVTNKNDDGWYEGVMDGVTGLFPGNYVEPCI